MTIEIIARETEVAVVEAFLDRSRTAPGALVLTGEAGIGKSSLWLASVAAARERGFRVLSSRPAETEMTLPNVVLGDLFGEVRLEELASLAAPRRHAFQAALLRETHDNPPDPRALGVAILSLLPVLGEDGPVLLAVDDDQWMDASSAATLAFALRRLQGPVVLLLSRRTPGIPATALEDAIDPVWVERLPVGPLSVDGIQTLLHDRLQLSFPRPMLSRIEEVSGGNPFFALELARVAADPERDLAVPLAVPPNLETLVGARLRALQAATRGALLLVAAHGRFPVEFLRALAVEPEALDQARAQDVVSIQDGVVRFTHPLLASTLYQGAGAEDRREAHRRLAMAVEDPVDRGRHLALAADGPDDELAGALEAAAEVARGRGLSIAAVELAEQALRLTPLEASDDRHRRTMLTARAHSSAGEGGRARAIAADLAERASAGRQRAEALILRADFEPPEIGMALLEVALVEASGLPELQVEIHVGLAEAGYFGDIGSRSWGERHARAALRIAERLDDDALRAHALSILACLSFDRRDPRALELAERAYRLAKPLADVRPIRRAEWSVGHVLTWLGNIQPAREWLTRRLAEWSERDELVRAETLWYLALVELWSGRWSLANDLAEQARQVGPQYGWADPFGPVPSALIALHRGDFATAREHSRQAIAQGKGQALEFHYGILAVADLWSGDAAAALANFMRAEEAADAIGSHDPSMRFWRGEYADALLELGRVDDAARLVDDWETAARQLGRERVLAQAARCRGVIAAARGDLSVALNLLEESVRRHEAVEDPFGRLRAMLALGVVRRRLRQKRSAREALEAARDGFAALGAASWLASAEEELGRIGGGRRIVGLSSSELRVATLVAEGRTNREIAAALFLGERTVASHLTHIYGKLGIRSRTELARHMLPHDVDTGDGTNLPTS